MNNSWEKNKKGIMLMVLSSIFVCFGQLMWKLAVTEGFYLIVAGFVLYGLGALVMLIAYRFGSLSVLQPVLSLNYVLAIVIGVAVLNESVSIVRIAGIGIIILGIIFIAGGDE